MMDACWDNEIVCDPLDDIVYTINDDRSTPGTVTQPAVSCTFTSSDNGGNTLTETECPLTQTLQYYDDSDNTWKSNTDQVKPSSGASC